MASIPDCATLSAGSRTLLDGVFDPRFMWPHNPGIFSLRSLKPDFTLELLQMNCVASIVGRFL
jgi:hypothetical protein